MNPMRATQIIKFLLLIFSTFLLITSSAFPSDQMHYSLKTPEDTIKTYYSAYETNNFNLLKKAVVDTHEMIFKKDFKSRSSIFLSYKIIDKILVTNEDEWHKKGDVDIFVEESWKDKTLNVMSFILRKYDQGWLIIDWVIVNEAEEPPDIEELFKQAEKIMKQTEENKK